MNINPTAPLSSGVVRSAAGRQGNERPRRLTRPLSADAAAQNGLGHNGEGILKFAHEFIFSWIFNHPRQNSVGSNSPPLDQRLISQQLHVPC